MGSMFQALIWIAKHVLQLDREVKVIEVVSNKPMPKQRNKYGFDRLDVGQSLSSSSKSIVSASFLYGKKVGKTFTSKKEEDGTYSVWRVT